LRSPGQLRRHYAPKARLLILDWADDSDLKAQLRQRRCAASRTWVMAHSQVPSDQMFMGVSILPHEAGALARSLYAELHRCDAEQPDVLVMEKPPAHPEWRAIADRLERAAAKI
jgi:L-threonylcarbamoyladenylate synthase